jgi:ureidoglycolate lyase
MKLATFSRGSTDEIGVIVQDRIFPISQALPELPDNMIGLISIWNQVAADVRRIVSLAAPIPLRTVKLKAPIGNPGKILAIGLNYADHISESGLAKPEHQIWFSKLPDTVNGPFDSVVIPRASAQVDYEGEMVIVIGRKGRHISRQDARKYVFGYCVGNDVSVRDWQTRTSQWLLGKSFDTHGPIGPWLTTADEIGDPHRLGLQTSVNGELRQNSNTRHLVFDVWDQIAYLSEVTTLRPGDIIFSGTPGGVGVAMKPPRFLKTGDIVRCEIEELGAIENAFSGET